MSPSASTHLPHLIIALHQQPLFSQTVRESSSQLPRQTGWRVYADESVKALCLPLVRIFFLPDTFVSGEAPV
eukprot:7255266-Pyramimonas_sp.AAC.1